MIQMQTDENVYGYLKIFDAEVASILEQRGFSYIIEKVNGNVPLYCFEATPDLLASIENIIIDRRSDPVLYTRENVVRF